MGEGFCVPHSTKCVIPYNELNHALGQTCDCSDGEQCHPSSGSEKRWCSCELY